MTETIRLTLTLHSFFMWGFIFMSLIGLIISMRIGEYCIFKKRVRLLLPMYYMFFASLFFTGIILFALKHFSITLSSFVMLFAWIVILITGIKVYKKSKDIEREKEFIVFAQKKYLSDIAISLSIFGITLIF